MTLPFGGNLPDGELATAADDVAKAITRARQIGPVTMNADAAAGWQEIYEELSANHPNLLGALTAAPRRRRCGWQWPMPYGMATRRLKCRAF
jgi:hypothetical protein